jgi:DNA polymerase I
VEPEIQKQIDKKTSAAAGGSPRLFLIDSMSYIFRAYHALPRLTNSKGQATHAVYGFNSMLRKLLATYRPEYVGAVFDLEGPTFRHETFADYKANRAETPEDLIEQIPLIRRLLEAMKIPVLAHQGYEADDVIGTLSRLAAEHDLEVFIISSDKDMLQLVGDRVRVLNPMKDDLVADAPKVVELTGVEPGRIPDLMALQGDAVDNIPGAPGIGPKGARELIQKYGSVEACLEHASEVAGKRYREALSNHRDQILLSKQLATIDTHVPVVLSLDEVQREEPDLEKLKQLYQELDFTSLLRELLPLGGAGAKDYREFQGTLEGETGKEQAEDALRTFLAGVGAERAMGIAASHAEPGRLALAGVEVALSAAPGEARLVPSALLPALQPWLEDASKPKAVHDWKAALLSLKTAGIRLDGVTHDTMLYSYLLNANESDHTIESVVEREFSAKPSGSLAEQADWVGQLAAELEPRVQSQGLERIYSQLELPLVPILAAMEWYGVKLDPAPLVKLSKRLEADLDRLCQEIYRLTGVEFNINSPKQLGEVLFEKLGLQPLKKTKGKAPSTAIDVLEELALVHDAPRHVLEYRQLAKLKNTYVDALPRLIEPTTGRLHTHYNQAGAATGRLSSSNPNLQNIPIRTELGREIRAAFVAEKGFRLVAADYSQIELRLLAHLSEDPLLMEAFRLGDDIHEQSAAAVFGVPPAEQTAEHRRRAKAVNYGIVYGLSAFGLSQQLGIPQNEAQEFIDQYFSRYHGVRKFIDSTLEEVRRSGEVRTFFGRLRRIPEINSKNWNLRQFAERTAVNTPLQGGAADLIKLAMLGVDRALQESKLRARMILQVHDELILEVPQEEVSPAAQLIRERMEQAHPFLVPIVAEVSAGENWRDMEEIGDGK